MLLRDIRHLVWNSETSWNGETKAGEVYVSKIIEQQARIPTC